LLYADAFAFQSVGAVTSGTFGPSAAGPVAMGYVPSTLSAPNTLLFADVRGNRLPVEVMKLPFIPHRYKRT
jgi:aminomethyltransferase